MQIKRTHMATLTYYPSKLLRGISLNDNFRVKVREGRFGELTEILAWYEYINDVILDHLDDEIKSTNKSGVWRYLISFKVILSFSQLDLINQIEMFLEFAPCHWKHWNCLSLWNQIFDYWKCYTTEFYKVGQISLSDTVIVKLSLEFILIFIILLQHFNSFQLAYLNWN